MLLPLLVFYFFSLKVSFSKWHHGLIETLISFWLEESESLGHFSTQKCKEGRVHERNPEERRQILCKNYEQISFWPLNHIYQGRLKATQVRIKELNGDLSCHCILTRSLCDRVCSLSPISCPVESKIQHSLEEYNRIQSFHIKHL